MIPRIRGQVGQVQDPPELKGKWGFFIEVGMLGGGEESFERIGEWAPFDTEEAAKKALEEGCRLACEEYEKHTTGSSSGKYIDMKTNRLRDWDPSTKRKS